ncbi:MAG: EAL domain-containing protein [Proteobacteria bacterium]|nr:EAL domain-containing protein [Pseudomonadota bacterium]
MHALQTEILEALVMGERFEAIADLLCRRAEELAPGVVCSILAITPDGRLDPVAAPGLPQHYSDAIAGLAIGPTVGSCGTAAFLGEPVEVHDVSTDPLWTPYKDLILPLGLMACWSSPIKTRDGRVAATFGFYYRTKRGPTELEHAIVNTCVHLFSIAIEHDETRRRNHALAYFDQLTGLPNRRSFDDMIFERIVADKPAFGLLVIDIDNLKIANDTMGHVVGDGLIQEVAARLAHVVPNAACRLGGDEFAVLVDGCHSHHELSPVAEAIMRAMREPFDCDDYTIIPQVTMGGVVYGVDGDNADFLRQNADFALYHAKEVKRGGYVAFEKNLRTSIALRMSKIRTVDEALNDKRVMPYYQPVVRMADGAIQGFESLARIRLDTGDIISAGQVQAALSDPSIAFRLTDQMLQQIARDMRGWMDRGLAVNHVGINLSTADFHRSDLESRLSEAFESVGVPLDRLALEVTETVLMDGNDAKVVTVLKRLRKKGVTVALDDFGTGYASLTHLIRFPVDTIKIDRSFVDRMLSDRPSRLIVELLVDLSRKLDMRVIAEGIETQAQADWLLELGCQFGQGYFFGRPTYAAATTRFIQSHKVVGESADPAPQKRRA